MDTAVYNHLLTQYRPKELTKYDTHKVSELRNVMNRIAKKTKTSPIYLVKLTDAKQSFALGIKESSMLLGTGLKELADTSPDGVFSKKKHMLQMLKKQEFRLLMMTRKNFLMNFH